MYTQQPRFCSNLVAYVFERQCAHCLLLISNFVGDCCAIRVPVTIHVHHIRTQIATRGTDRLMLIQSFRPFLAAWIAATWHLPSPDPKRVDKAFKHDHMLPLIFVTTGSAGNISGTRCVIAFSPLTCTSKTHTLAVTDIRARVTLRKCAHSTHLQRGDPLRSTVLLLVAAVDMQMLLQLPCGCALRLQLE